VLCTPVFCGSTHKFNNKTQTLNYYKMLSFSPHSFTSQTSVWRNGHSSTHRDLSSPSSWENCNDIVRIICTLQLRNGNTKLHFLKGNLKYTKEYSTALYSVNVCNHHMFVCKLRCLNAQKLCPREWLVQQLLEQVEEVAALKVPQSLLEF
jgi:hypothetical protein